LARNDREIGFGVEVLAENQRGLISEPPADPERSSYGRFDQAQRLSVRRIHRPLFQDHAVNEHGAAALEDAEIAEAMELGAGPAQRAGPGRR
jgi:hypothetical protein